MKRACRPRMLFGLCAAEDGVSVVEFAFVAAFLMIPLVIGAADFGTALFQWMQVGNAARAGAEDATYFGSFNQASIVAAVTNATSLSSIQPNPSQGATPSPAPTQFCGCPTASGVTQTTTPTSSNTPLTCGSLCPSGVGFDGTYVTVSAQADLSLSRYCAYGRVHPYGADNRAYQLKAGGK
jgi:Flp pilus assembly protein TadG